MDKSANKKCKSDKKSKRKFKNDSKNIKAEKMNNVNNLLNVCEKKTKSVRNFERKINNTKSRNNSLEIKKESEEKTAIRNKSVINWTPKTEKDTGGKNTEKLLADKLSSGKRKFESEMVQQTEVSTPSKIHKLKGVKFQLDTVKSNENSDERNERTIFVGNLPHNVKTKHIQKMFSPFGGVEKVWLRGAIKANGKVPKKITIRKKLFEENHPPLIAYVLYSSKNEADTALQMNGTLYEGSHLRVDSASYKGMHNQNKDKSIFLGNLPFVIKDDDIWNMFRECGEIESVRIIRDSDTGIGKGFGYVNFKSSGANELALQMDGESLHGREIRISRIMNDKKRGKKMGRNEIKLNFKQKNKRPTKFTERAAEHPKKNINFRGQTASLKKKKPKMNKLQIKNKVLAQKLAAKPVKKRTD